jgi:hypothetical protein
MRIVVLLSLLLWVCLVAASTLQVLTLDDMTAQSSAVVHAHVIASHPEWRSSKKNVVITRYTLKADRYMKGNLGSTFEIVEPGGSLGMLTTTVAGAPAFQVGEEVVLFVWTAPGTNMHQSIGFEQGAFRVTRNAATGARTINHSQPFNGGGRFVDSAEIDTAIKGDVTSRSLDEFIGQVGASVRRVAARQTGAK